MSGGSGRRHEAETAGQDPGDARGEDKSDAGHQDEDAEDEHGNFVSGPAWRSSRKPMPSRTRTTPIWMGVRTRATALGTRGRFGVQGDGRGFKEAPAGFGFHVGGEFLAGGELVDEAAVDFALQLEDAAPAAILDEDADAPAGDEQESRAKASTAGIVAHKVVKADAAARAVDLGPDGAFEGFVG